MCELYMCIYEMLKVERSDFSLFSYIQESRTHMGITFYKP